MRFERAGARPDGSAVKVAFSLAFAADKLAPDIGFAVCQQHYPGNFWNADYQRHPNRIARLGGAIMVADNPTDHHIFLSAFAGERELRSSSAGITVTTPRGDIQVVTPAAFEDLFDVEAPDIGNGARLAALRLIGPELSKVEACVASARIAMHTRVGRLIVAPQTAFGATLVFEAASSQ